MMDRHLAERADRTQDRTHPGNDTTDRFVVIRGDSGRWQVVDRWDGQVIASHEDFTVACGMVAELRLRLGR